MVMMLKAKEDEIVFGCILLSWINLGELPTNLFEVVSEPKADCTSPP